MFAFVRWMNEQMISRRILVNVWLSSNDSFVRREEGGKEKCRSLVEKKIKTWYHFLLLTGIFFAHEKENRASLFISICFPTKHIFATMYPPSIAFKDCARSIEITVNITVNI